MIDSETIDSYTIHMRIGQLSAESGVSIPSIKYYMREGLLPAGQATSANQADYSGEHLARLRLIRGLVELTGVGIEQIRQLLVFMERGQVDSESLSYSQSLANRRQNDTAPSPSAMRRVKAALNFNDDLNGDLAARAIEMVARTIDVTEAAGTSVSDDWLRVYARQARALASEDIDEVARRAEDPGAQVSLALLGTLLGDVVIEEFRRYEQARISISRFDRASSNPTQEHRQSNETPAKRKE